MRALSGAIALGFCCAFFCAVPGTCIAADWNGFRGQERQGYVESSAAPTTWSRTQNIHWKSHVPGAGHSSPTIVGSRVYLTTAYASQRAERNRRIFTWARWCLLAIVAALGGVLVSRRMCSSPAKRVVSRWIYWTLFLSTLLSLAAIVLFDTKSFAYDRDQVRAWLGGSLTMGICLSLALTCRPWRRSSLLLMGAISLLFAALVIWQFPAPEQLWHGRRFSAKQMVVFAISLWPFAAVVGAYFVQRKKGLLRDFAISRPLPSAGLMLAGACFGCAALAGVLALLLRQAIQYSDGEFISDHLAHIHWHPNLGWLTVWSIALLMLVALLAAPVAGRWIHPHRFVGLAGLFSGAVLALGIATFAGQNLLPSDNAVVRGVSCLDATTGQTLWQTECFVGPATECHRYNSLATPTAVVAGDRVLAYFGSLGLACLSDDGDILWTNTELPYQSFYGLGASPAVSGDLAIIVSDMPGKGYIAAIRIEDGEVAWQHERLLHQNVISGVSRTPLIVPQQDRQVVLTWGNENLSAYDLETGSILWDWQQPVAHGDRVASLVLKDDRLWLGERRRITCLSFDALAKGQDPLIWQSKVAGPNCSTPIVCRDLFFYVTDHGIASCLDAHTGKLKWKQRFHGEFYSSLIAIDDRVLFTNHLGTTFVVAAAPKYELVSCNEMDDPVFATLGVADHRLFLRGAMGLWCIGAADQGPVDDGSSLTAKLETDRVVVDGK